jgi:hypothetical protein
MNITRGQREGKIPHFNDAQKTGTLLISISKRSSSIFEIEKVSV